MQRAAGIRRIECFIPSSETGRNLTPKDAEPCGVKELPSVSMDLPQFAIYSSTYPAVKSKVSVQGVASFAVKS